MEGVTELFVKIAVIIGLVLMNGFFVAAEFAIVKVRSTQIEVLLRQGSWRAKLAQNVVQHLDAYLSATQLGITISSLALGWLGEPFIAHYIAPILLSLGVSSLTVIDSVSFAIAFAIITFLHIVLGELAPKTLAIRKPQQTTMWVAAPLIVFHKVLFPFIWLLNHAANAVLRLVGVEPVTESEAMHSKEELQMLFSEAHAERQVSALVKKMLTSTLELRTRPVTEILTPRPKTLFVSLKNTLAENIEMAEKAGFSRFPLCEGDLDTAIGMVHIRDLLRLNRSGDAKTELLRVKRKVIYVPDSTFLEVVLSSFLTNRCHMAIVLDEYGGTSGVVTLEDILEELVGEIQDEFDQESPLIVKLGEGEFLVDGTAPLHDLALESGLVLESSHTSTVGGFVIECFGRLPHEGEVLRLNGWNVTARIVRTHRVHQVHIVKVD